MQKLILKSCVSFAYNHLTVSKHTNDVLREILNTLIALLMFLLLAIDWDKTLDSWEVLK